VVNWTSTTLGLAPWPFEFEVRNAGADQLSSQGRMTAAARGRGTNLPLPERAGVGRDGEQPRLSLSPRSSAGLERKYDAGERSRRTRRGEREIGAPRGAHILSPGGKRQVRGEGVVAVRFPVQVGRE
jgi:hypothetical protein